MHLGWLQKVHSEGFICTHTFSFLYQHGQYRRDVIVVANGDVHNCSTPLHGLIAQCPDVTIGQKPHGAVCAAQPGHPQTEILHRSAHCAHGDHVAHSELILSQDEQTAEVVADEALGAQSNGDASD